MKLALAVVAGLTAQTATAGALSLAVGGEVLEVEPAEVSAEATTDITGNPALQMKLGPGPAARLAELTRANLGQIIDVRICGAVVISPRIQSEIASGELLISGDFTRQRAQALAHQVTTADCTGADR